MKTLDDQLCYLCGRDESIVAEIGNMLVCHQCIIKANTACERHEYSQRRPEAVGYFSTTFNPDELKPNKSG